MKFTKLTIAFLSVFFCLVVACGSDGINDDPKTPDVTEPVTPNEPDEPDNPSVVKVPTLQKNVQDEWKIDSIDDGFIYYNYERYDDVSKAQQIVNVLEIDLLSNKYKVEFTYNNGDSLSTTAQVRGAIGGINGNMMVRFIRMENLILELYMAAEMERLQLIHINNILQSIC